MKSRAGPSSKELTSVEDFNKAQEYNDVYVIGFFSDDLGIAKEFQSAAGKLRDSFKCFHTTNADVIKAASVTAGQIILYRPKRLFTKLEESSVVFDDSSAKSSQIQSFMKDNYAGLAGHLTPDNGQFFKKPQAVVYYQLDYVKNPKGSNYYRNRLVLHCSEKKFVPIILILLFTTYSFYFYYLFFVPDRQIFVPLF